MSAIALAAVAVGCADAVEDPGRGCPGSDDRALLVARAAALGFLEMGATGLE
jgi:hypothetical protein